jgi:hypothetical protein
MLQQQRQQKLRPRRRMSTQYSSTSKVLVRRKKPKRKFPGDTDEPNHLFHYDTYPPTARVKWLEQLFVAYWAVLHAAAFMVPKFRRQNNQEGLENIVFLFDTLRDDPKRRKQLGCNSCTEHIKEEIAKLPGNTVASLVYDDPDPEALARWSVETLHNGVHARRQENENVPADAKREPVPYETVRALYVERAMKGDPNSATVMEAWLLSQYNIKLHSDLCCRDIIQTTDVKKQPTYNYIKRIGNTLQEVYPHGVWSPYWWRLQNFNDSPCCFQADWATVRGVGFLFEAAFIFLLLNRIRTVDPRVITAPFQAPSVRRNAFMIVRFIVLYALKVFLFAQAIIASVDIDNLPVVMPSKNLKPSLPSQIGSGSDVENFSAASKSTILNAKHEPTKITIEATY